MRAPSMPGADDKFHRPSMRWWLGFMDQLDRLGYVAAGFSLLALCLIIFVHAWYIFLARPVRK